MEEVGNIRGGHSHGHPGHSPTPRSRRRQAVVGCESDSRFSRVNEEGDSDLHHGEHEMVFDYEKFHHGDHELSQHYSKPKTNSMLEDNTNVELNIRHD